MAGGTSTLTVLDSTSTTQTMSEVLDAGNSSAKIPLVARPPEWAVNNTSTAAAQATISKAAGGAGVRHVCTGLAVMVKTDSTGNADLCTWNLRDGATGAGTVLATGVCVVATGASNASVPTVLTGLSIVGTANTAMTLEFSVAGATHTLQIVNMFGYDIS
jgi:hypothetical protein